MLAFRREGNKPYFGDELKVRRVLQQINARATAVRAAGRYSVETTVRLANSSEP